MQKSNHLQILKSKGTFSIKTPSVGRAMNWIRASHLVDGAINQLKAGQAAFVFGV